MSASLTLSPSGGKYARRDSRIPGSPNAIERIVSPRAPIGTGDPILRPLFRAQDEAAARNYLDRLMREHALPIIASVVRREFGPREGRSAQCDAQDVQAEIQLLLLSRLIRLSQIQETENIVPIADFHAYVKSVARHVCLRCRRRDGETTGSRSQQSASRSTASSTTGSGHSTGMWQCSLEEEHHPTVSADRGNSPLEQTWRKETLQRAWQEILLLPEKQRASLLLNFCDTSGTHLLPLLTMITGVTIEALAGALGFSEITFRSLQESLPLEDQTIATQLGLTRREVINARLAARRRLARRCQELIETVEV